MRLGVLDIGSNTGHLLVVDAYRGAAPMPASSYKEPLRLAEHLDDDGTVTGAGVQALTQFVSSALTLAEDKGCEEIYSFATSAVRDAGNSDDVEMGEGGARGFSEGVSKGSLRSGRSDEEVPERLTSCRSTTWVAGPFDPGDDRQAQLLAAGPAPAVEDVLLQGAASRRCQHRYRLAPSTPVPAPRRERTQRWEGDRAGSTGRCNTSSRTSAIQGRPGRSERGPGPGSSTQYPVIECVLDPAAGPPTPGSGLLTRQSFACADRGP